MYPLAQHQHPPPQLRSAWQREGNYPLGGFSPPTQSQMQIVSAPPLPQPSISGVGAGVGMHIPWPRTRSLQSLPGMGEKHPLGGFLPPSSSELG